MNVNLIPKTAWRYKNMEHLYKICPRCHQSIVLTDDGRFVVHNEPWVDKIKEMSKEITIYHPRKCIGSGSKPKNIST
jgi:hypothetical protein